MAKNNQYFEHESLQDKDAIISYLKALTEGIEKGEILLSDEEETLLLKPGKISLLRIKATNSKKNSELRLRLSWSNYEADSDKNAPLFIKAKKASKSK
ncbi:MULTISPECIES: amphi-Trp domain-containing protein [Thiomicrorhabdus]|uniref:Amphi-Trp domain-containing protein n=1 Tax=Thiomicrorhabdus heinhorstiae TaxID=2748010 RepID=A0ABS0BVK3_9GAMM|nr:MULTISPECIES: amphi-Trp domain-containing protein [Thiomicrorhabdus]MBF6057855.1 amphi-Trp domain-containing protein [Thiomicrorhabdus heinhorstiae]